MLRVLELTDWKSFAQASIPIAPFTLLVGANGSGKSNLLDALRFLQGFAHGWPLSEIVGGKVEGGTRIWNGIRGGSRDLIRRHAESFHIRSVWLNLGDIYDHSVAIDGVGIASERLDNIFQAQRDPGDPSGLMVEWLPGSMAPGRTRTPSNTTTLASGGSDHAFCCSTLAKSMRLLRFLELAPQAMRGYCERGATSLADDGNNLSGVLWSLCQQRPRRDEFVDWLVEFCSPEITGIEFDETASGDVMLHVVEQSGSRINARSLSDGTLRYLGLLTALQTMHDHTMLVIEDLDHGMHPSRLRLLVEAVQTATRPRAPHLQEGSVVIATTHSPSMLEAALEIPECLPLLFARDPASGATVARDIRSIAGFDEIRQRRDLGYLMNTNWLARAL